MTGPEVTSYVGMEYPLKCPFLEWTREGHRQSDEHWNRFKGNVGETFEGRGGAHIGFSQRIDTLLN